MNLRSIFQNYKQVEEFPAGTTVFAEGSTGNAMYVVLDGEVEVRVRDELVGVLGPGEIVGEMALVDAKPRSATIVARSDCRLASVDERRFLFMVSETPFFAIHVMRVMAERLRKRMKVE